MGEDGLTTLLGRIKCSGDSEILSEIVRDTVLQDPGHDFPIFVKLHRLYLAFGRPRSSKQLELFRYLFSLPRYGGKKFTLYGFL